MPKVFLDAPAKVAFGGAYRIKNPDGTFETIDNPRVVLSRGENIISDDDLKALRGDFAFCRHVDSGHIRVVKDEAPAPVAAKVAKPVKEPVPLASPVLSDEDKAFLASWDAMSAEEQAVTKGTLDAGKLALIEGGA